MTGLVVQEIYCLACYLTLHFAVTYFTSFLHRVQIYAILRIAFFHGLIPAFNVQRGQACHLAPQLAVIVFCFFLLMIQIDASLYQYIAFFCGLSSDFNVQSAA